MVSDISISQFHLLIHPEMKAKERLSNHMVTEKKHTVKPKEQKDMVVDTCATL